MSAKPHIVVLGGGFAGLESAFYLRYKLRDRAEITLVSDRDYFLFKPNTIYIPFGKDPQKYMLPLAKPTRTKDIHFTVDEVQAIDVDNRKAMLANQELSYDYLVVATGAGMRPDEIPGFAEHALSPWTPDEMLKLREGLREVVEEARDGERPRLLFLVPPNNKCSGPLYELVMMTDTWLRGQQVRDQVELIWTTVEQSYIQAFGPRLNTVVEEEFAERGVTGHRGLAVASVGPERVEYQNGETIDYDVLVGFPPYVAARNYASLPSDDRGFIQVDADSRRVVGQDRVFAIGDAGNFPVKQAFLALLQADAAADHVAAEIAGVAPEVRFEPVSMCVMEEFNKATFAQVPLKCTGDPQRPVVVDEDEPDLYKVGVSPLWRLGKATLGFYLPWRFGHGQPFHAGLGWTVMDAGLKVMSKALAK